MRVNSRASFNNTALITSTLRRAVRFARRSVPFRGRASESGRRVPRHGRRFVVAGPVRAACGTSSRGAAAFKGRDHRPISIRASYPPFARAALAVQIQISAPRRHAPERTTHFGGGGGAPCMRGKRHRGDVALEASVRRLLT